ncbi:hypothetical protein A1Q1_03730 [Trichosporon asahii var. asahii CBS 2479]|nr:hypothetical protein A1Q1_03730 [Trichosporon asahii var. asahii CBS 2479]EJT47475.1 hypothetical protein A1Q1_03730 [Trichosporon asahii var. asahii CBS 2479]
MLMLVLLPFLIGTAGAQNAAGAALPAGSPSAAANQPPQQGTSGFGEAAPAGSATPTASPSTLAGTPGAAGAGAGGNSGSGTSAPPTSTSVSTAAPSASDPSAVVPGQDNPPPPQWWCNNGGNATYCPGALLQDVQLSGVFTDSKTFVDRPTNGSQADVFAAWNSTINGNVTAGQIVDFVLKHTTGEGQELSQVAIQRNASNATTQSNISDPIYSAWVKKVDSYWDLLIRESNQSRLCNGTTCDYSLIPLNHTIVVPGGRYREVYYWDSYWILQGLLASKLEYYAWSLLQNFMDLIEDYGFIPNGGRKYYLNRSQPPVFVQMVHEYIKQTGNVTILQRALPSMERELAWWHQNRTLQVTSPWSGKNYTVAHYAVNNSAPRPEGYVEDYDTVNHAQPPLNASQQADLYAELATGAESGWDYSARWLKTPVANVSNNEEALRQLNLRAIIPHNQTGGNQTTAGGGMGSAGSNQTGAAGGMKPSPATTQAAQTNAAQGSTPPQQATTQGATQQGGAQQGSQQGSNAQGSAPAQNGATQTQGTNGGGMRRRWWRRQQGDPNADPNAPTSNQGGASGNTGNGGNTGNTGNTGGSTSSSTGTGKTGNTSAQGQNGATSNQGTGAGTPGMGQNGGSSNAGAEGGQGTGSGTGSTGTGSMGNQTMGGGDNTGGGNGTTAEKHRKLAQNFKEALLDLNWDGDRAFFYDFNTTDNKRTPFYTAGGWWPLWQNVTPSNLTEEQALRMASGVRYLLQKYDGAPAAATYLVSGLNWDFPNVWPLHVYTTIKGLDTLERTIKNASVLPQLSLTNFSAVTPNQLGMNETQLPPQPASTRGNVTYANQTQHLLNAAAGTLPWPRGLALEIAARYLNSAFCSWYSTGGQLNGTLQRLPLSELNATGTYHEEPGVEGGKMFEKFNITDLDAAGGGGEYTVQVGFGWTNGVVLWAAERFGQYLRTPTCPLILITQNNGTSSGNSTGPPPNSTPGGGGAGGAQPSGQRSTAILPMSSSLPPANGNTVTTTPAQSPQGGNAAQPTTSAAAPAGNNGGGNGGGTSASAPTARSFQFVGRRIHN